MISRVWLLCGAGLLMAVSSGADEAKPTSHKLRFSHASFVAYPGAVISLKDPASGMIFYVESDGRKLVALDQAGGVAWGLDVLEASGGDPVVGRPVVRHLKLDGANLLATCAKHTHVSIDVATGKVTSVEAD